MGQQHLYDVDSNVFGALGGLRVVELGGMGPGPFGCMLLADHGADVVRVRRPGQPVSTPDLLGRGKHDVELDLKSPAGRAAARAVIDKADVLVEGFRPGVAERLGLGPTECCNSNERLVYARMTGWGQHGPLAHLGGHDINYIAASGALEYFVRVGGGAPTPPLNLVGDFGGGGMMLAFAVAAALYERERSGLGQVIDVAMVDGVSLLMTMFFGADGTKHLTESFNGTRPMYDVYQTRDGRYVAVGATDQALYDNLLRGLGLEPDDMPSLTDRESWPNLREVLSRRFASEDLEHWTSVFTTADGAVTPVLTLAEAVEHTHATTRTTHVELDGTVQPAPAPRFSRTPAHLRSNPADVDGLMRGWGVDTDAPTAETEPRGDDQ